MTSDPPSVEPPSVEPPSAEPPTVDAPTESFPEASALRKIVDALRAESRLNDVYVAQPHPLLVTARGPGDHWVVVTPASVWRHQPGIFRPLAEHFADGRAALLSMGTPPSDLLDDALARGLTGTIATDASPDEVYVAVRNAFDLLDARRRNQWTGEWVNRYQFEIRELFEVARAFTTERDITRLLDLILDKSCFITNADAGSIYVVQHEEDGPSGQMLRFKLAHNHSVKFDASEFSLAINEKSMAGYVAQNRRILNLPDVYQLGADAPYGFDRSFDRKVGYRTKSMICAPLLSRRGEVLGVLQLINRKREPNTCLINFEEPFDAVIPFDERDEDLTQALASFAGAALENALLYAENQEMLKGFVRASVEAIEQRDPTTSGHSKRVASMTVELAKAVERVDTGPYKNVSWNPDELRELEYASLLHDFGKIGVREKVLVKAKKLYPKDLAIVQSRFALARKSAKIEALELKLEAIAAGGGQVDLTHIEQKMGARIALLEEALDLIVRANEPRVLEGEGVARLEEIAKLTFLNDEGQVSPLITTSELCCLQVPRGSLTADEFDEIRGHVSHTFEFLSTIPWGRELRRVPQIAGAHHERLDGTGYPARLRGSEIPVQSKMMTVTDIFDALTASDRPYKKAVPLDRALHILNLEVKDNHIDGDLVRIFSEAEAWQVLSG